MTRLVRSYPVLPLLLAWAALLTAGCTPPTAEGAPETSNWTVDRPNILWISVEDISPFLGAYGDPLARTPVIDQLARDGMRFTNAFASAPVCGPARAGIITGMYQNSIGAHNMRSSESRFEEFPGPYQVVPPFYVKAFPEYLRAAGYYTTNNEKTDYQFGVPFTIWDESSNTAHWRNRPDPDQPFFSVINLMTTHESRLVGQTQTPRITDPAEVQVPPYYPDTPVIRQTLARLYDNIAAQDQEVAAILRQLEEDGLAENTIVFFWSDHGGPNPREKRSPYDSGLRVPVIVRVPPGMNPSFSAGAVNDEVVSLIDLGPTVLSLAGVPIPAHMQGRALLGAQAAPEPEYVFAARDRMDMEYDMIRAARDQRYLYIRNFQPELPFARFIATRNTSPIMRELLRLHAEGGLTGAPAIWFQNSRPPEELYDTQEDPHNIRNLASDPAHRATLQRMRQATNEWMQRIDDQGLIPEAELVERMWPGKQQPVTAPAYIMKRGATTGALGAESILGAPPGPRQIRQESAIPFSGPTEVEIYSPTQGASIAYTIEEGPDARWKLYTGPFKLQGPATVRARAIRYGYRESQESRTVFSPE